MRFLFYKSSSLFSSAVNFTALKVVAKGRNFWQTNHYILNHYLFFDIIKVALSEIDCNMLINHQITYEELIRGTLC